MAAKQDEYVLEDFLQHLQKTIPGFKREANSHQWELAKMVWEGGHKRRQHDKFEGAMSFHYKELEQAFGRTGFNVINARLGFFTVTENWSMDKGWTKGYWFSEAIAQAREKYFNRTWRNVTRMTWADGRAMKKLPKAVAGKDMRGITTTAWRNAKEMNNVRINLPQLRRLQAWLRHVRDEWRCGRAPADLFLEYPNLAVIERLAETTSKIIRLAKTDVAGHGYVAHRYLESESGRLYAKDINLQTTPTIIKQAALAGLWEYDFSNCHYAILMQMAAKFGNECQAIGNYLVNKKATRQAIADQAGITVPQAKTCLLAIIYGARAATRFDNAIPDEIGRQAAARLYRSPIFISIHQDIKKARRAILNGRPCTANGRLSNAMGKSIETKKPSSKTGANPRQQLAHLIQGVEAKALKTAIDMHPDDIVLLQHDGFAATTRLDGIAIMEAVYQATGYRLELEEARIQVDPEEQFLKYRIQSENDRKANTGAGSRLSLVS
ncbi:hypothetical protein H0A71_23220 [Alcaligenaceae bacterium]|nr:hypothetical protein [Alcaligenaceae bacterium]